MPRRSGSSRSRSCLPPARRRRSFAPCRQRAARRRGGILRIQRQQHDLVGVPVPHGLRGLVAERVPVTHGDEALRIEFRQFGLQRRGLRACQLEQRRTAAKRSVARLAPARTVHAAMRRARNGRTKSGTRRIAGSLNRFARKGRIASGRSGPPRLNRTTATLGRTHLLHQGSHVLGRGLRHDAVAQVEDDGRPRKVDRIASASRRNACPAGHQRQRIEIALQRRAGRDDTTGQSRIHRRYPARSPSTPVSVA